MDEIRRVPRPRTSDAPPRIARISRFVHVPRGAAAMALDVNAEILQWASTRPRWMQDAMRLIVTRGAIDDEMRGTLLRALKSDQGINLPTQDLLPLHPLRAEHLRADEGASVRLLALKDFKGVNRIAASQDLQFSRDGITVVYGGNAAGKSGYTRVLRRVCRARTTK